jgi:DNA polymerase-3 subunit gamma/tau
LQAKYKVYIIDEVHMLSQGAFNALLKTLEEPPSHVIFILATTEPHKVIPTIISRCQRYDFVRVNMKEIQHRIEEVLKIENISYEEEAVRLISQLADGGVRDALSILEQCIAYAQDDLRAVLPQRRIN